MKILIIQSYLFHFRIPLLNELAKHYDVTVIHSENKKVNQTYIKYFKEIIVPEKYFGPFIIQKNLYKNRNEYDVIIAMFDLKYIINSILLFVLFKKYKFLWWGIGYGNNSKGNRVRTFLSKISNGTIVYSQEAKNEFNENGVKNVYVAPNTVLIEKRFKCYENIEKDIFLFIGALEERKDFPTLLEAYRLFIDRKDIKTKLIIIGSGQEKEKIINLINKLRLDDYVECIDGINDESILLNYYKRALCSISFGQAGLSVLQSFAFGVPFITKQNAISGGEKYNIEDGQNGFLCQDNEVDLADKMTLLANDIIYARKLGKNAYDFYTENRTIPHMAQGILKAIENTIKNDA